MGAEITKEVNLKEVIKGSQGELIKLRDFDQTKEILEEIAKKHSSMKVTDENLKEGKEARVEIREYRYALQNVVKHNKDLLNQAKKQQEEEVQKLIDIIQPVEDNIDDQIKSIEQRKQNEKEEKERIENERIAAISQKLSDYRSKLEVKFQIGKTEEDLKEFNVIYDSLQNDIESEEFQEFEFEAVEMIDEFLLKKETIEKRVAEEKELQVQKEEQEKKQKEQEEKEKQLEAERKKLEDEKQKELDECYVDRIDVMNELGFKLVENEGFLFTENLVPGYSEPIIREMDSTSFRELKSMIKNEISEAKAKKEKEKAEAEEEIKANKETKKREKKIQQSIIDNYSQEFVNLKVNIGGLTESSSLNNAEIPRVIVAFKEFEAEIDLAIQKLDNALFPKA